MLSDKKAAKKIIKIAKKHPDWYNAEDVKFAKKIKKTNINIVVNKNI